MQLYATCGPATARQAANAACSRTSSLSPERRIIIGSILSRLFITRGVGSGEWGVGEVDLLPHSPLPTPHSLSFHSPPCASGFFTRRFGRSRGFRLESILVRDDGPVLFEVEVGAVVAIVANQAAPLLRRRLVIPGGRRLDVFGPRAVTGFAMNVGELRRGLDADEALVAEAERMTADTVAVEHSLLLFQNGEGM